MIYRDACYLAIATAKQKDLPKARDYIEDAKKRDPQCPLLNRAAREIERSSMTIEH